MAAPCVGCKDAVAEYALPKSEVYVRDTSEVQRPQTFHVGATVIGQLDCLCCLQVYDGGEAQSEDEAKLRN